MSLSDNRVMVGSVWLCFSVIVDACFYIFLLKRNKISGWDICRGFVLLMNFVCFQLPLPLLLRLQFGSMYRCILYQILYSFKKQYWFWRQCLSGNNESSFQSLLVAFTCAWCLVVTLKTERKSDFILAWSIWYGWRCSFSFLQDTMFSFQNFSYSRIISNLRIYAWNIKCS